MRFTLSIRNGLIALAACMAFDQVSPLHAQNPAQGQLKTQVPQPGTLSAPGMSVQQQRLQPTNAIQQPVVQNGAPMSKTPTTKPTTPDEKLFAPQPYVQNNDFAPVMGTVDRSGFSRDNPPPQPQVAAGRCQPCTVAIDCADNCGGARQTWKDLHQYPFQPLAHGEFMGPIRLPATMDYRLRVGDQLGFVFIDSPTQLLGSYRLMVGDEVAIESATDDKIRKGDLQQGRGLVIQPDGKLTVSLLGEVEAAGLTIPQLRHNLEIQYKAFIREPSIDVTPIKTNSLKSAILNSVDARAGTGGQNYSDTVHADGTVRLPKIGAISVLGMTVDEVKREINLRFGRIVSGLEVEPRIATEAQHFVFVTGEVATPNRYQLLGPTSVTQAIALAGGHKLGGNLRQIVIFRYAEDWRLLATCIDLKGAMLGKEPTPADNIWLRDSDTIIVPPMPIKQFDNFVKLVFTDGVYGIFPFTGLSITRFQGGSINAN